MLKKEYIKSKNKIRVTFELAKNELPEDQAIEHIYLVGDFNEWDQTATPLKRNKQGAYRVALELEPGRAYEFRYVINGRHWCNDWAADAYAPSAYGADNCVVEVPYANGQSA